MKSKLKQQLAQGELSIGSWLMMGEPTTTEIMASNPFDWLVIDLEHTVIDLARAQHLISLIQARQISALVRVSKNEEVVIKRVLDAGAQGIIVPKVCSKADAEQAVAYAYYPPQGERGVGLARAQDYGVGFNQYRDSLAEQMVVIAQIEHIDGIQQLRDIIQTPGIDGVIIGPYDLSASMGYPGDYERPDVKEALAEFRRICQAANFPMGFHVIQPEHAKLQEKIDEGYRFLAFSIDFMFLGEKLRQEMGQVRS